MISIIIPVYNKIEMTRICVQLNMEHCKHLHQWIIIDNNSDDHTKAGLNDLKLFGENLGHHVIIYTELENTGTAKAWNRGLTIATGDYICILNNDCVLMPAWDEWTLREFNANNLELFTPLIIEPPNYIKKYTLSDFLNGNRNWEYFHTKNMGRICKGMFGGVVFLGKKELFNKLGNFDENYWLTLDDIDYIYHAMREGAKTGITGNIVGFHHLSATRKEMVFSELDANNYFQKKWGFNFQSYEHRFLNKLIKSYRKKLLSYMGLMTQINMILPSTNLNK
jgi:GT2 family glycosyltransferase